MATRLKSRQTSAKTTKGARSPLDSQRHELLEKQSLLQAQIEELQRSITEAPRRAAASAKREREAILTSAVRPRYRHNTLMDTRYNTEPVARRSKPAPMLRAERRAARQKALALLVALVAALAYAACTFAQ